MRGFKVLTRHTQLVTILRGKLVVQHPASRASQFFINLNNVLTSGGILTNPHGVRIGSVLSGHLSLQQVKVVGLKANLLRTEVKIFLNIFQRTILNLTLRPVFPQGYGFTRALSSWFPYLPAHVTTILGLSKFLHLFKKKTF